MAPKIDPALLYAISQFTGYRSDAGETANIATALRFIHAETYDVQYALRLGLNLVPVNSKIPEGALTHSWFSWDRVGLAKFTANAADDAPNVSVFKTLVTSPLRLISDSYQYTTEDLRNSQYSGIGLDVKDALAARLAIDTLIDQTIATGYAPGGLTGLLNNAGVPLVTPTTGAWSTSTTPAQIFGDTNKLVNSIVTATKQVQLPDTLVLPTNAYDLWNAPIGSDFSTTILETFLKSNPYIKQVEQWWQLNTANAAGTGRRIMAYKKDPGMLEFALAMPFKQLPPQPRNFAFVTPCEAKVGSVCFYYPLSAAYMDLE